MALTLTDATRSQSDTSRLRVLSLPVVLSVGTIVPLAVVLLVLYRLKWPPAEPFNLSVAQNVFTLFYAIFWGFVSEVSPRWKAFNWPVALKLKRTCRRTILSMLFFVTAPIAIFFCFFNLFRWETRDYFLSVVPALVAAHAPFGLYRLWIGVMESAKHSFYYSALELLVISSPLRDVRDDGSTLCSEPYLRWRVALNKAGLPVDGAEPPYDLMEKDGGLNLHSDWAWGNLVVAVLYLLASIGAAGIYGTHSEPNIHP